MQKVYLNNSTSGHTGSQMLYADNLTKEYGTKKVNILLKKKVIKALILIIAPILITSCEKFLDINHDPDAATEASLDLIMPSGIASTCYVVGCPYQTLGGYWAQYWTQSTDASQYRNIDSYNIKTDDFDDREWGELYRHALTDYRYIRNISSETENWSYYLMATVMSAYTFHVLTDLYETIPFTEALKGKEGELSPKFDQQEVVYDGLIVMLDEALSKNLNAETVVKPGDDDFLFGGDMEKWVQFANTLKLKIYLRQSYIRQETAQAGIAAMYEAGAEFLAENAAMTQFTDVKEKRNPLYDQKYHLGLNNEVASYTLLSFLSSNNDSRLNSIFNYPKDQPNGPHKGLYQGDYSNKIIDFVDLSFPILGPTDPVILMSSWESYFLQAEAIARGWASGNAKNLYEEGIEASFTYYGLTNASSFYGPGRQYEYNTSSVEKQVESIIIQKWVAMANLQNIESWIEHNRTHYPTESTVAAGDTTYIPGQFTISLNHATNEFPKRLLIPNSETDRNANAPISKSITEKMWWDVK